MKSVSQDTGLVGSDGNNANASREKLVKYHLSAHRPHIFVRGFKGFFFLRGGPTTRGTFFSCSLVNGFITGGPISWGEA